MWPMDLLFMDFIVVFIINTHLIQKDDDNYLYIVSSRDVLAYNWENVWEWGQGDKAYKLANAGYKVNKTNWLMLDKR